MLERYCKSADAWGFPDHYAVPGFVNAHTHLELTFQLGHAQRQPEDFVKWVDQLIENAKDSTEETFKASYREGLAQSLRLGSTTVIDHCRRAAYLLPESRAFPLRVTTAYEFSGLEEDRAESYFESVREIRVKFPEEVQAISPVGPHSISAPLYDLSIRYARENDLLLCGHLAETVEELRFVRDGTGPFTEFLVQFKPRDLSKYTPPGCTPTEHLHDRGGLHAGSLAAHCNYLTDRDIEILAETGASVAHCPGSYKFFGHKSFRLRSLMEAGVNVCLGTDSLASNDTLSVLDALRDMRKDYEWLSDEDLFRLGTVNGHKALNGGKEPETLPEDYCIFPWREGTPPAEVTTEAILKDLLAGTAQPVAVVIGGEVAWPAVGEP
ncbi:MAG: amidohydrolase family protein [Planctomycetota bacterium]|jgi:cytosine/adenosine deaminase-related metal-dependent hydrolase